MTINLTAGRSIFASADPAKLSLLSLTWRGSGLLSRNSEEYGEWAKMSDTAHYLQSSLRENVLEHVFIGDLLRTLWCKGRHDIEVLRSEVDSAGYDLVLECNGILRHVQLKSSYRGSKTSRVKVNAKIADKPCGCVIWVEFDPDSLKLGPFRWFGGKPKEPISSLGDRIGRHTKGDSTGKKSERPNIRVLSKSKFGVVKTMDEIVEKLFGVI